MNARHALLTLVAAVALTGCPREEARVDTAHTAPAAAQAGQRATLRSPAAAVPLEGPAMSEIVAHAGAVSPTWSRSAATASDAPFRAAPRDFNLDGRSDIVWHNVNSGELYYWLMGPNGVVGENGNAYLPIGHTALGTGDFNGDGRTDMVSASSVDVRISFGQPTWGFGMAEAVSARPPGVWTLAGITDVNGDGRSDLVWHHRGSGELYYWLMDGTSIFASQGGAYLPAGSVALAGGDFDGDGRGDILSATRTEVRISFGPRAGTGWIFSEATLVQSRPPAECRFAGVGDINGDGRTDVLWHNMQTREFYDWLMSGAVVAGGQGGTLLPERGRTLSTGDIDGDGRADLIYMGDGDIRIAAARVDGSFAAPVTVGRVPFAGWKFVDDVEKPRAAVRGDVDGDGKGELLFFNTQTRELYAWLLDGATVANEQGGTYLPPGFAPLATGDFNGDGRVDVFSTDGAEVRLSLARPDGGFGESMRVADRPAANWLFGGLGDVDADSRVDVLWFDTEKKEIYAWLMSGPSIVGGKGGNAFLPDAQRPIALGDFNGDGMADVLTVDNETSYSDNYVGSPMNVQRLYNSLWNVSLSLVTGSFAPSVRVGTTGWYTTSGMYGPYAKPSYAGLGDVNGDGRDDLAFASQGLGCCSNYRLSAWIMNGTTFTTGQGPSLQNSRAGLLDTNGDGAADVLEAGSTTGIYVVNPPNGYAARQAIPALPPAPWRVLEPAGLAN